MNTLDLQAHPAVRAAFDIAMVYGYSESQAADLVQCCVSGYQMLHGQLDDGFLDHVTHVLNPHITII